MLIALHRERFETPLIHRPGPRRPPMRVPALRVRHRQQPHELRQIFITAALGPQHQMPVIRHEAIGQQPHIHPRERLHHHPLKRGIIRGVLKKLHPPDTPIQDVIHQSTHRYSSSSRHRASLPRRTMKINDSRPLFRRRSHMGRDLYVRNQPAWALAPFQPPFAFYLGSKKGSGRKRGRESLIAGQAKERRHNDSRPLFQPRPPFPLRPLFPTLRTLRPRIRVSFSAMPLP